MDEATIELVKKYGLDREARRLHNRHCEALATESAAECALKTENGRKAYKIIEEEGGSYYSYWYSNKRLAEAKKILKKDLGDFDGEAVFTKWCETIEHQLNNAYDI